MWYGYISWDSNKICRKIRTSRPPTYNMSPIIIICYKRICYIKMRFVYLFPSGIVFEFELESVRLSFILFHKTSNSRWITSAVSFFHFILLSCHVIGLVRIKLLYLAVNDHYTVSGSGSIVCPSGYELLGCYITSWVIYNTFHPRPYNFTNHRKFGIVNKVEKYYISLC